MQAHIVLAHPEPQSYNAHLSQVASDLASISRTPSYAANRPSSAATGA
jgi:hypothetical protein